MRRFLASSTGVAACAAFVLPLALPSGASAATLPADPRDAPPAPRAQPARSVQAAPDVPGSTQSLPLPDRPEGSADPEASETPSETPSEAQSETPSARSVPPTRVPERGRYEPRVRPFSLVGVVWDDAAAELHGTVQIRTRAAGTGDWSGWQDVETHTGDHGADPGTAEAASGRLRGATAPLWVGESDGVEVRVRGEDTDRELPRGLRLELVDPGQSAPGTAEAPDEPGAAGAPGGPALLPGSRSVQPAAAARPPYPDGFPASFLAGQYTASRPGITSRKQWGANESLREGGYVYTRTVKAAFVHHTSTGNNYTCAQAPSVLRGIYRYHVVSSGWRDFGYNFAVDKCGNIYEGRAGGVAKAVLGAHTLGFNSNTMGVAVLGTYNKTDPSAAVATAVARLTAWKLGLFQANPRGKVTLTSGGSGKYKKGRKVSFNVISGHRDGVSTDCPGTRLYNRLPAIRTASADYQGRT
ncbi:N-acetylmuramoyl-L-alanine amidase [Streptomyces tsukubensis]|uniref:N-acetylmuramoyl-L-alanine amidase n=1 Tax=Streptomyces tsukubensis (strain DSM 42081 / NBRC 108919 / NRRL 18488 / 9993) TaxID=1114943 RepID=A0A7G3UKW5_STRT9|nr:N-acetylmuramoyl-L-alanine amidase [Streptomyces tsukubensis]AZK94346.1 N-acetylmuramoyl-L-alanine amidase [Streptomyces tsukubensis]QKM69562.1 N-acetylmuramoyl-L-alanine amidase [Streptomyces tsukubensis NRRL18488]TAI42510.1 N-acetylmuramoyl-L-alanine amidase [Streptomyces tsukubensis]